MWWDERERQLCISDVAPLSPSVDAAITANVRPLIGLVQRFGCRVGFHRIRSRYHAVVLRRGALETVCGVYLLADSSIVRELPDYTGHDDALCVRCVRALVTRELERLDATKVAR
jgi:hypothetical protein